MSTSPVQPVFPVLSMLAWLTAAAGAMGAINALALPGVFGGRPGIAEGAMLTALVVVIAGVVGSFPLAKARTTAEFGNAFFVGMGVRVALALAAAWVLIVLLKLPDVPVAVSLMLAYLPALFIETRFIIRHIAALDAWHKAQQTEQASYNAAASGHRSEKLA